MEAIRRAGMQFVVCVGAAVTMLSFAPAMGTIVDEEPLELNGVVKDEHGNPLRDARVFVHSATPKEASRSFCSACYADCRKATKTIKGGHFKIADLDPTLHFNLLVVAKDCRPQLVTKIDPKVKPIEIALGPLKLGVGSCYRHKKT